MATVEFIYGLGSRYSYLASTQIARIARDTGAEFHWRPVASRELIARRADNPFRTGAGGQYDWTYRRLDAEAWAEHYGVPFRDPVGRLSHDHALPSMAAFAAGRQGQVEEMSHRLFRLIFVDDRERFDRDDVLGEARALGLDVVRFQADLESPELAEEHEEEIRSVEARGVWGVPTFLCGDRLFWGNDRLILLEAALKSGALCRPVSYMETANFPSLSSRDPRSRP